MESGSEEEIDIQYTDWESETDPTASESDEAFIVYDDEPIEMEDYDSSYVPTESEEVASFTTVSDYGETFNERDLGEYITVLDEREIEGNDGRMTELLLNFWAEERVAEEIRDLLHVSRNGPVG
ncbi:hypothetical protein KXW14_009559 [Aspergillus fumigatus]|uniref:Uncharacterized protein n=1 Tax=Aspergillus fumigatus (strain ATCC MYA-4609 / CBS 101355 / FGSC A1100 / Af293) TaxID=330879 RepID=Q4WDP4_ASPFU|nr:hypothetical protein AFUA_5G00190 [Aspergillus fumigatus Af293]KAH1304381.1 hypothetical protein KXX47_008314 [Aspergillus fumigatus]EAL86283.1 hypothetical protein AFUA_5G00190 [Aspergillus fumigatus Af293]KAH1397016.1 hypothetical protein KXX22_008074 [Aspergillus fumigatus]KAH1431373.1 hypothetical protein KXX32_003255 [Aspergillus fumigatus]KAH2238831.1 hypothetical protein KXW14_009559 [Aspergillus fumigatus]